MKTTFYTGKGETAPQTVTIEYEVWTYDVWGNAQDGFEVNDRRKQGTVRIVCQGETCNPGTPHEFIPFGPTDRQLATATGWQRCEWEWTDSGFYANQKSNGRPIGELVRTGLTDDDK